MSRLILVLCLLVVVESFRSSFLLRKLKPRTGFLNAHSAHDLSQVDIRVGKILEVKNDRENLNYITRVDVGDTDGPRTIVAGLTQKIPKEQLVNKLAAVCCNLPMRSFGLVRSAGMLLCAHDVGTNEWALVEPAEGSSIGEQIQMEGVEKDPIDVSNKAQKVFKKVVGEFRINKDGVACHRERKWTTSRGDVRSTVIGPIS